MDKALDILLKSSDLVIVLEEGDEVIESIKKYAKEEEISGFFVGIGAVRNPIIGYYDLEKRQYIKAELNGSYEVISLLGTISYLPNGEPFIHAHIALGDSEHRVLGGHLFRAEVSVTLELIILRTEKITRQKDEKFGLWLIGNVEEKVSED